jgi:eukaryotic-like serine/threonine-protein kinase
MSTAHVSHIGPYRIESELGRGSFGAVYLALRDEPPQRVALKVLHESKLLLPEIQNRFVREIALLQRLDHDNIVRHYECGLHEGSIYCAMELVDSGTLKDVLQARTTIPWREAAEVALEVCRGLDHAHRAGCVHRDLKPANLYLSSDGRVKLGDLGLARDLDASRLTADGQTMGTWRYMPPEQITGAADIDGRLDLYALGCILFEMLTGRPPFDGPHFAAIFDQHLETPPERVDQLGIEVPTELANLIDHLLAKRPADRPENAAVVADRLTAILSGTAPGTAPGTVVSSGLAASPRANPNLSGSAPLGETPPLDGSVPASTLSSPDRDAPTVAMEAPNLTTRLRSMPVAAERTLSVRFLLLGAILVAAAVAAALILNR